MSTFSSTGGGSGAGGPPRGAERRRLWEADEHGTPWRKWGPYLAERAWGTVREDYSANGDAWSYFPFEQAASRAYRWNEDGMAGMCDDGQLLCLALALWNGRDSLLKERLFGLTNTQGNHGEDVKECWWYTDATPSASWLQWRYHYPHEEFPYEQLKAENARRGRDSPELELTDTGIFERGYFVVKVTWAKDGPESLLWRIEVDNAGDSPATLDVLPTIWARNTWSWGPTGAKPVLRLADRLPTAPAPRPASGPPGPGQGQVPVVGIDAYCEGLGHRRLRAGPGPGGAPPEPLFCDNETNTAKLWGVPGPAYPKDGIADHVLHGAPTVNPAQVGTKAALRYRLALEPGAHAEIRLRFGPPGAGPGDDLGPGFEAVLAQRKAEADEFFADLAPAGTTPEEANVLRQAAAGMIWGKQFYHYDVEDWLRGDPGQPAPPPERLKGRNSAWRHIANHEVISMPDTWEYPWYASWDLAFHAVAFAHLDPAFAKSQLILLCREWYMHPNGQLPAYEWDFGAVNPPVQAWAAMAVWRIDARRRAAEGLPPDNDFIERVFHKLLINFTWWVNKKDAEGNNVFEGGFLGLDNIGLFDRSAPLPVEGILEQSDGTAWMAMYCVSLLEMALRLADTDPTYEDVAIKFYEHFTYIARAMRDHGLWDAEDGFYYDVVHLANGERWPVRARSMVGVVPLLAVTTLHPTLAAKLPEFMSCISWFDEHKPELASCVAHTRIPGWGERRLLSVADREGLVRALQRVLGPDEMLSPYGVRSLSRYHLEHPFVMSIGGQDLRVDYEPAESTTDLFGGNSNWRGPVWFPLNYLLIEALHRYDRYFGSELQVEHPTGSGNYMGLAAVAEDLARRLVSIFLPGPDGRRPVHGERAVLQQWGDLVWFHEYFHGDTGAGLGASHQTGWTGLVVHLIAGRGTHGHS